MRRIVILLVAVAVLAGVPAAARAATTPAAACAQPRLLILSAYPAEMGGIMKATTLDSVEPIRSAAPQSKEFWTGTLESKPVIEALVGIGPVDATQTTNAAFTLFDCISGVVFSGVAGAGSDHLGPGGAARQSRIGDVTVPDRWSTDGGTTWSTVDPTMFQTAAAVAPAVKLENTTPVGDRACACVDPGTVPGLTFPYQPTVLLHGDASTTDPFNGHAAPCLQHGGDLAGCEPCPVALGTSPDPERFAYGAEGILDPAFFTGLFSQAVASNHEFIAYDDETGAVATIANAHAVPFIGFRAISDGSPDPLMLPGYPSQFVLYDQLAADNETAMALAFVQAWH